MPYITKSDAKRYNIPRSNLQTILIPKKMGLQKARDWLHKNKYHYGSHRSTLNFYRFMQEYPIIGAQFYTKKINNGIELVFQEY